MRIASKVLVFFCFPFNVLGYQVHFVPDIDIYNDLVAMNTTCSPEDMCLEEREEDSPGITPGRRCSCHAQCAVYDTCCYNSPHRGYAHPLMECTRIRGSGKYFLVGKCPSDARGDSFWKSLCEDPWNEEDDILKIAPVTSLDTRTVYKNIYCFRCHESSDNFHQWYLHVKGFTPDETADSTNFAVSYDQVNRTWVAESDDKSVSVRVKVHFSSAPKRSSVEYVHTCNANVISDCHDSWTDDYVRDKCRGYYALRYVRQGRGYDEYKNPHCAICNYVAPEKIFCPRNYTSSDFPAFDRRPPARLPVRPTTRPPVRPTAVPRDRDTPRFRDEPHDRYTPRDRDTPRFRDEPHDRLTPRDSDTPRIRDEPNDRYTPRDRDTPRIRDEPHDRYTPRIRDEPNDRYTPRDRDEPRFRDDSYTPRDRDEPRIRDDSYTPRDRDEPRFRDDSYTPRDRDEPRDRDDRYRSRDRYKPRFSYDGYTPLDRDRGGEEGGVKLFSFRRLIGGMFYGGDKKSAKLQNKCDEYHLWDPYGKRCRKIGCALPGYGLRNGRCRSL